MSALFNRWPACTQHCYSQVTLHPFMHAHTYWRPQWSIHCGFPSLTKRFPCCTVSGQHRSTQIHTHTYAQLQSSVPVYTAVKNAKASLVQEPGVKDHNILWLWLLFTFIVFYIFSIYKCSLRNKKGGFTRELILPTDRAAARNSGMEGYDSSALWNILQEMSLVVGSILQ